MKSNNIGKFITEKANISQISERRNMSAVKYDDFMQNIVDKIRKDDFATLRESIINMIKEGELEQVSGNFYKYKDFHILELFKKDGIDYSNKLKTIDKLNLGITQKYIETIERDGSVFIITQIPGTEKGNLIPLWKRGAQSISKENRLEAFHDLQKLTKAGLVDDKVAYSNERWYVNSDNKIIIPNFEYLRPINKTESQKEIVEKYYNILFK